MVTVTHFKGRQKKKRKKKTLAQQADEVAVKLQKLVRMKAADDNGYAKCVSCGVVDHWKNMDGGHFISRGKTATKIVEENIHPQCKGCNLAIGKGNSLVMLDYNDYMCLTYGSDFVEELKTLARQVKKWDIEEIECLSDDVKKQINEQSQRLGDV